MSSTEKIIIIGTGGHARVVAALVQQLSEYELMGFLDLNKPDLTEKILGVPVIGHFDEAAQHQKKGIPAVAIAVGDNQNRKKVFEQMRTLGFKIPALIHPDAKVDKSAEINDGTIICCGAIVGVMSKIGSGVIVNTGSIIDHETEVGSFGHVAPGCSVAGRVQIGEGTFIGIGTSVRDQIKIGKWTTIGAGAVIIKDIPQNVTVTGVSSY